VTGLRQKTGEDGKSLDAKGLEKAKKVNLQKRAIVSSILASYNSEEASRQAEAASKEALDILNQRRETILTQREGFQTRIKNNQADLTSSNSDLDKAEANLKELKDMLDAVSDLGGEKFYEFDRKFEAAQKAGNTSSLENDSYYGLYSAIKTTRDEILKEEQKWRTNGVKYDEFNNPVDYSELGIKGTLLDLRNNVNWEAAEEKLKEGTQGDAVIEVDSFLLDAKGRPYEVKIKVDAATIRKNAQMVRDVRIEALAQIDVTMMIIERRAAISFWRKIFPGKRLRDAAEDVSRLLEELRGLLEQGGEAQDVIDKLKAQAEILKRDPTKLKDVMEAHFAVVREYAKEKAVTIDSANQISKKIDEVLDLLRKRVDDPTQRLDKVRKVTEVEKKAMSQGVSESSLALFKKMRQEDKQIDEIMKKRKELEKLSKESKLTPQEKTRRENEISGLESQLTPRQNEILRVEIKLQEIQSELEGANNPAKITKLNKDLADALANCIYGGKQTVDAVSEELDKRLDGKVINNAFINTLLTQLGITDPEEIKQCQIYVLEKSGDLGAMKKRLSEYIIKSAIAIGKDGNPLIKPIAIEAVFSGNSSIQERLKEGAALMKKVVEATKEAEKELANNPDSNEAFYKMAAAYQMAAVVADGKVPFTEQILAARYMGNNNFVDLSTGAGKTLAFALANALNRCHGRKSIHLVTHDYYTQRDFRETHFIYKMMGFTVSYISEENKDVTKATNTIENNDITIMSYGTLSFIDLEAKSREKEKQGPSTDWFKLRANTHLTMDECDVAPRLSDFIIAAMQSNLSLEEYLHYYILMEASRLFYESGSMKEVYSLFQGNIARVADQDDLSALAEMLGFDPGMVSLSGDGKTMKIGSQEIRAEDVNSAGGKPLIITGAGGAEFSVTYSEKEKFKVNRLKWVGEDTGSADSPWLHSDMTSGQVTGSGTAQALAVEKMREAKSEIEALFPGIQIKEATWEEFLDAVKAICIDELGVDYIMKYTAKLGGASFTINKENGTVSSSGSEESPFTTEVTADGNYLLRDKNGKFLKIIGKDFLKKNRTVEEQVIFIGTERFLVTQSESGDFVLTKAEMNVVLLDNQTGREQGGQRKDRFHTLYEMKHQRINSGETRKDSPPVRGDNKSTEMLSFTDVARYSHSYGGASGSVATVAGLM
ncbi:MAG TPA: hypothetical protein PKZ41_01855, partial [Candidatus Omnitrophota bacterium]|nr:hypothetical protein [Candidatus Omnitrophota bacterium]